MFFKIGVLKNFAIFTGKHLCQSLFFNKVAGLHPQFLCFFTNKTIVIDMFGNFYHMSVQSTWFRCLDQRNAQMILIALEKEKKAKNSLVSLYSNDTLLFSVVSTNCKLFIFYFQATLSELKVFSDSEKGANVSMNIIRNGSVVAR